MKKIIYLILSVCLFACKKEKSNEQQKHLIKVVNAIKLDDVEEPFAKNILFEIGYRDNFTKIDYLVLGNRRYYKINYDSKNRITKMSGFMPTGDVFYGQTGETAVSYDISYNDLGNVDQVNRVDGELMYSYFYKYDNLGRVTSIESGDAKHVYTYRGSLTLPENYEYFYNNVSVSKNKCVFSDKDSPFKSLKILNYLDFIAGYTFDKQQIFDHVKYIYDGNYLIREEVPSAYQRSNVTEYTYQ